jgi:hypothetical protein
MNPVQESLPQPEQLPEIEAPHEKLLRAPTLWEKITQGKFKLLLLLIIAFIIVDAGIYLALSANNPKESPSVANKPQQIVTQLPSPTPTIEPTPITFPTLKPSEVKGWKTFTNKQYGYSLRYPREWSTGGPYAGEFYEKCLPNPTNKPIAEFSRDNLTNCGFVGEMLPSPDIPFHRKIRITKCSGYTYIL